ncbi:ABC transporter ATP-binding protein [Amycolatopsis pithecellobii]|uniref:ATP-binding cassette domain-containing protein n=1 Tax=Amycolatopsis pithecellobii TaxID=664692 RepID=A0A6N7YPS5_9PSEU|nr:ABC transporter ATP-binding protein [Amycolatopsis pithecellobii]MTD54002.1 ATP-binding cassette domain-containing protein [Amycolatopsis pithecellobii]
MTNSIEERITSPGDLAPIESRLSIRSLHKSYGAKPVIGDLSFEVAPGEFVCVVGPSGVGKTTLLKCLSGLIPPSGGDALLDGRRIDGPPREMALVFQDYTRSLMPWLTVERNVLLPLRGSDLPRAERRERVVRALAEVGLSEAVAKYPWQLSGGMQQRVAIARAIAYQPEIMLMDEPFASLDAQTRFDLEDLLLRVRDDLGVTILFVTHDIDEAVYLADRVIVLGESPCRVLEIVDVDLPRPRDQITTRSLPAFASLRTRVLTLIRH